MDIIAKGRFAVEVGLYGKTDKHGRNLNDYRINMFSNEDELVRINLAPVQAEQLIDVLQQALAHTATFKFS